MKQSQGLYTAGIDKDVISVLLSWTSRFKWSEQSAKLSFDLLQTISIGQVSSNLGSHGFLVGKIYKYYF